MKRSRSLIAGIAIFVIGLCGLARAQVLEQAPSDAIGVFEVRDLQGLSTKIAKMAKNLGLDQFEPKWSDPLGAITDQFGLKQGINKSGDMAIAFYNPQDKKHKAEDGGDSPPVVVLVPINDYKAFLGNFQDVKGVGDDISQVTVPKNNEKLFVVQRGKYAVSAMSKGLLANHDGMKLHGPAANEVQTKDAIVYVDLQTLRPIMQKGLAEGLKQLKDNMQAQGNPFNAQMPPMMMALVQKAAEQFVSDTRSFAFSLNMNDTGIGAAYLFDFEAESYLGKLTAECKNTDQPLLTGLPKRDYFFYAGGVVMPKVADRILTDVLDTMKQQPAAAGVKPEDLSNAVDSVRKLLNVTKSTTVGVVAPEQQENFIQTIAISHGDAKKILEAQKDEVKYASAFSGLSGNAKMKSDFKLGESATVDGVDLQSYTIKFDFDANDPLAMQQKQMLSMLYGTDGMSGKMGVVNDDTFVNLQGASDNLVRQALAAAKENSDNLDQLPQVRKVAAELPKQRIGEVYIAVDNIATSVVKLVGKIAGGQNAMQFRLPPNLPPVGISASTDGPTARLDVMVPQKLVESMTAAVMQMFMGGNNKGGGI